MDSLTARLMSRSGLNRADPTVPPTQNMRMVTLKEKYGPAEQALHDARSALEALQFAQINSPGTVEQLKRDMYQAMEQLEGKEADFFASRYFGSGNKKVVQGWNVDWKSSQFTDKIRSLVTDADARIQAAVGDVRAQRTATLSHDAAQRLHYMHQKWGRHPRTGRPQGLDNDLELIRIIVEDLRGLVTTNSTRSMKADLRDAEICYRLAQLVFKNRWDLPYDLR